MRRLPISNGFTSDLGRAEGSSPCGLVPGWPWSARPLRSSPITGPSSLLRAVPPLCPASVLCRLRCPPLAALPLAAKTTSPGRRYRGDRFSCSMPAPAASSRHLYTGHRQSSTQAAPWLRARPRRRVPLFPGVRRSPGCDAIVPPIDASAVVHTRSSSRRPPDPLTAGLFPQRSPPRLLTGAACGGLGSPPALASPEGQTSITGTARFVPATFYIATTPLSGHTAERRVCALAPTGSYLPSVTRFLARLRADRRLGAFLVAALLNRKPGTDQLPTSG